MKYRVPMTQLVTRYRLQNKRILSVGSGVGLEEYWFWKNGGRLTLVDLDEHKSIEPLLREISQRPVRDDGKCLRFFIGDAQELSSRLFELFDVCYFSSFTPDETRRAEIQRQFLASQSVKTQSWPQSEKPFMDLVIEILQRNLAPSGFFISQSYYGGVDVLGNPHFITLMEEQLSSVGVQLLEVYYLQKAPGVILTIGFKGFRQEGLKLLESIAQNPQITRFHGRSPISNTAEKAFELNE
jgi:hypothetical protein